MKKKISLSFLLFVCIAIVCSGAKNIQSSDVQITIDSIAQEVVPNFLVGNSYLIKRESDNMGMTKTVWILKSKMKGSHVYGTYINFVDTTHYIKGSSQRCGNSSSFSERGTYRLLKGNKLALNSNSIRYREPDGNTRTYDSDGKEMLMDITFADSILYITPIDEVVESE